MLRRSLALAALLAGLLVALAGCGRAATPEEVARSYAAAMYAWDLGPAYDQLSAYDQQVKTKEEYLREKASFSGFPLQVVRKLASFIEFSEVRIEGEGDRLTLTAHLRLPDGNVGPAKEALSRAENDDLSPGERRQLLADLERQHRANLLVILEGEESFTLVRSDGRWGVLRNWADRAVAVHLSGQVRNDLPWSFAPVQETVQAIPGETMSTVYRVKNLSDRQITAKAIHTITPGAGADYLWTVTCFCFFELTLDPGEEQDLPFTFRVLWEIPSEVKSIHNHYDFYPIEYFPEGNQLR